MRLQDDLGPCCSNPWQSLFISQNLLPIGYTAWHGFSMCGLGLVSCHVDLPITPVDWRMDVVPYHLEFIPESQVDAFLQRLGLDLFTIREVLQTVRTYNPNQEVVLFLTGGGQIEIDWLKNLAISPRSCYQQVRQRWAEFQVGVTMPMGSG
jgi:hypothetical protein